LIFKRVQRRENSIIVILAAVNVKFKKKKKHRVVKAHLRKGGGDIIKGIHSFNTQCTVADKLYKED
jgi:hypothetical protein